MQPTNTIIYIIQYIHVAGNGGPEPEGDIQYGEQVKDNRNHFREGLENSACQCSVNGISGRISYMALM
jgi:hypothetical protein